MSGIRIQKTFAEHANMFTRAALIGSLCLLPVFAAWAEPATKLIPSPASAVIDARGLIFHSMSPLPHGSHAGTANQLTVEFARVSGLPPTAMSLDVQTLELKALQAPSVQGKTGAAASVVGASLSSERVRFLWTHRRILTAWYFDFDLLSEGIRKQLGNRAPTAKSSRIQGLDEDTYAEINELAGGVGHPVLKKLNGKTLSPELPRPTEVAPLFRGTFIGCIKTAQLSRPLMSMQAFGRRFDPARSCGLMSTAGRWMTKPEFEFIEPIHIHGEDASGSPILLLLRAGEPCVATMKSPIEISCLGQPLSSLFSGGRLAFSVEYPKSNMPAGRSIGYLSPEGNWAIPPTFSKADPFLGTIATIEQNDFPGIIDRAGQWLTPPLPNDLVTAGWLLARARGSREIGGYGMIDYSGRTIVPTIFLAVRNVGKVDTQQNATVCHQHGCGALQLGRPAARPSIAPVVSRLSPEKSRAAAKWTPTAENGVWGYKDGNDRWVIKRGFDEAEPFESGLAKVKRGENWGVITEDGKWHFKPEYAWIKPFSQGVAVAESREGKQALLHVTGERIALDAKVESAFAEDGLAIARALENAKFGFKNRRGEWIIQPQFWQVQPFSEGVAVVFGILSKDWRPEGFVEPPFVVRSLHWLSSRVVAVRALVGTQERIGLMDTNGRWLLPTPAGK